jgi:hypothetical protein
MYCGKSHILVPYVQLSSSSVVQPLSRIRMTVSLYAAMATQKDILVGRQEIACEPARGSSITQNSYMRLTERPICRT